MPYVPFTAARVRDVIAFHVCVCMCVCMCVCVCVRACVQGEGVLTSRPGRRASVMAVEVDESLEAVKSVPDVPPSAVGEALDAPALVRRV